MKMNRNRSQLPLIPLVTAAFIGVMYVMLSAQIVPLGDDINFTMSWLQQNDVWYAWPRYAYRLFSWNNGRLADMLTPVWLAVLPEWLRALTNGIMTALFFVMVPVCGGIFKRRYSFGTMIVMALIAFTLRWDSLWMEFCATYNYVWSSAFALMAIWMIFKHPLKSYGPWCLLLIPFCGAAGAMHEACGFALSAACGVWWLVNRKKYRFADLGRRLMFWAFIAGGVFTLCSPGAYGRVGMNLAPESTWSIISSSAFYVVIMLIIGVIALLRSSSKGNGIRTAISEGLESQTFIWFIAALLSSVFMLMSGYGGRPGWFAQVFALVACIRMIRYLFRTGPTGHNSIPPAKMALGELGAIVIAVLIGIHYVALFKAQRELSAETREVIRLFQHSKDGVVFFDPTPDHGVSKWLLGKTHGVPDADDSYYLDRFSVYYGEGPYALEGPKRLLLILPTVWKDVDLTTFTGELNYIDPNGDRHILSTTPFATRSYPLVEQFPRRVADIDGQVLIERRLPGERPLYYYTTLHEDRGEK